MKLEIAKYIDGCEARWDKFVMEESVNGTFLHTRNFLNYHPKDRFDDASIMVIQGNTIVAVVPAVNCVENGKKCFFSHKGSTFGGIVVSRKKYNISTLEEIFAVLEQYFKDMGYEHVFMKTTSDVFSREASDLLSYFYYKYGYKEIDELSFYIDCEKAGENFTSTWSASRRRDLRYSLKNNLVFRCLNSDEELEAFYHILEANLERHGTKPVHTLSELKEFRDKRLTEIIDFYGVFYEEKLIAGTMLFYFGHEVMHTQYLAQNAEYSGMFTMNFLNFKLIELAKSKGFKRFSFGISTEERGKVLNKGLAVFKEGFGTDFCNNRSFCKNLK